ncbi:MAG TPA: 8-amino-7-oxononanoate synthase [Urbifossiella sp.]|jgi:8-amino-7-oxononanoate synthase|nr:8-amino-7-oxononanoate synthase [Urbifossiella sp.]
MTLAGRWTAVLDDLRGKGRYRSFRLPAGLDFTSNDYLGYAGGRGGSAVPAPPEYARSGMASRLLRGHHAVWDEVESLLADWHKAEAALVMTSGYAANEGLIATLAEPGDWVAVDELSHACIIDGLRLARPRKFLFRHNDLNHLEDGLRAEAAKRPEGRELFVVTESLFSMDGDTAPLRELVDLTDRYGAHLIVDEAHSTGCFGPRGSGCVDAAGVRERVLATVHTGGKALGLPGAYVCGSKLLKEFMTNTCRHLIFTTALPAAVGAWWREQVPRVRADDEARARLHANAAAFRSALAATGTPGAGTEYVVPVVVGGDEPSVRAATELQRRGYDIRAIRPPTVPAGTCRLRVSVHANHDPAVLARLAGDIAEVVRP